MEEERIGGSKVIRLISGGGGHHEKMALLLSGDGRVNGRGSIGETVAKREFTL